MVSSLSSRLLGFSASGAAAVGSSTANGSTTAVGSSAAMNVPNYRGGASSRPSLPLAQQQQQQPHILPRSTYARGTCQPPPLRPARGTRVSGYYADKEENNSASASAATIPSHPLFLRPNGDNSSRDSSGAAAAAADLSCGGGAPAARVSGTGRHHSPLTAATAALAASLTKGRAMKEQRAHDVEERAKKRKAAEVQYAVSTIREDLARAGMPYSLGWPVARSLVSVDRSGVRHVVASSSPSSTVGASACPPSPLTRAVLSARMLKGKAKMCAASALKNNSRGQTPPAPPSDFYQDNFHHYADLVSSSRPFYKSAKSPRKKALAVTIVVPSAAQTASAPAANGDATAAAAAGSSPSANRAPPPTAAGAGAPEYAQSTSTLSMSSMSDTESSSDGGSSQDAGANSGANLPPRLEEAIEAGNAARLAKKKNKCGGGYGSGGMGGMLGYLSTYAAPMTEFAPLSKRRKKNPMIRCPKSVSISLEHAMSYTPEARILTQAKYPFLLVHCNAAFSRLTGTDSATVVGRPLKDVLVSSRRKGLSLPSCAALCSGTSNSGSSSPPKSKSKSKSKPFGDPKKPAGRKRTIQAYYAAASPGDAAAAGDRKTPSSSDSRQCRLSVLPVLAEAETHQCASYGMTFSMQIPASTSSVAVQRGPSADDGTSSVAHFSVTVSPCDEGKADTAGSGSEGEETRRGRPNNPDGEDDLSDWEQDSVEEWTSSPDQSPIVVVG
uniref:PAS domain-containing protein n=1 Tax=Odontella aurita TaxID=265563 RepID=A0A7S4IVF9_9STRA|mmetsp:Transcript_30996/g.92887  ORF Transcript_30996/g.92887 Transcript_30996/m.92887 type:complete len:725 (+) Transcript_30996:268-2442(+)